jgi:glycosyltransferase involved in cell wall biosynthesis
MGSFWPDGDASGANQSLKGLCLALADAFEFRIVARDRPFGAKAPTAPEGLWIDLGFAQITYLSRGWLREGGLRRLLRETPYDLLMLNGFFDREFTLPALIMRRLGWVPRAPTLLSPRGEFGDEALKLKRGVKRAWLAMTCGGNLLRGISLHATSDDEALSIAQRLGFHAPIRVAENIVSIMDQPPPLARPAGGPLRIMFLGRITPVKNLDYALRVLWVVQAPVLFDIYGPVSDARYGALCKALAAASPPHVEVRFKGGVANVDAPQILAAHDLMFLPTRGENFGHSIYESLCAATPVLISDATPWRNLEALCCGFDLPLDDPLTFAAAIERMSRMAPAEMALWRDRARRTAEQMAQSSNAAAQSRAMLKAMLDEQSRL